MSRADAIALPAVGRQPRFLGRWLGRVPMVALSLAWLVITIYPLYYIAMVSFETRQSFSSNQSLLVPSGVTGANYATTFENGILHYFLNSVIVTIACMAGVLVVSLPLAYAIARLRNRYTAAVFRLLLLGLAVPIQACIIPIYVLMIHIGLYNTLFGLIPAQVAFGIPITVLILVNFIRDIPQDLFAAMRLDGVGDLGLIWHLVTPLSRPALTTVAIYNAIQTWNNFLFPLVLTQSSDVQTLPLALQSFEGQFGIDIPGLMAAVVLSALPVILLYVFAQRQLVGGLTAGFGK
ncbi:MAG: carbohydrate ABC transporter permease [Hyphomicrobiales bacterium]|nr:carbohydrate ABC transporter permease [Hyphomicrobiales bacterium]